MSFTFFGVFTDRSPGLADELFRRWPAVNIAEIEKPFSGLAVRFPRRFYTPAGEDIPESVRVVVQEISRNRPKIRFVVLRTEYRGGTCGNWGQVIVDGRVVADDPIVPHPNAQGTLRRLIATFGADIGASEIFEPLSRDFPWGSKGFAQTVAYRFTM